MDVERNAGWRMIMITRRLVCKSCHRSTIADILFDALYQLANKTITQCPFCSGNREIHLQLDFGHAADRKDVIALAAFLPKKLKSWTDSKQEHVTTYPFLVIIERPEGHRAVWMPCWDIAIGENKGLPGTRRSLRYGQNPSYTDLNSYTDLVEQATDSGLLNRRFVTAADGWMAKAWSSGPITL
jgi:hypothetical protein